MRRTEQEFKAEILRRSEAYRRQRAQKRKKIIGVGICACLCVAVIGILDPFGASSEAPMAADLLTVGAPKDEASMSQNQEFVPEYALDGATPMEDEPAAEPQETPQNEDAVSVESGSGSLLDISVSQTDSINSWPLSQSDAQVIQNCLSGDWIPSAANCLCDYTLYVDGLVYRYHSDCGTIQNESGQSLTLSENDRILVNEILTCSMN